MNRQLLQRKRRTRARISGTAKRPRASVWRGSRSLMVQLVDDMTHRTMVTVSSHQLGKKAGSKMEQASQVGTMVAEAAKQHSIKTVVFDRGGYRYHGRVKAVAQAMRDGGLLF